MKVSVKKSKKKFLRWFITKILTLLILLTGYTARVRQVNMEVLEDTIKEYGSVIIATWHKNIFFSIWLLRNHDLTALISSSDDGEVIYNVFTKFGYKAVRGSTTRGGIPALKQLIKLLEQNTSIAITPDGPNGPKEQVKEGIIKLAQMTNTPIIPLIWATRKFKIINSWDNFVLPYPFSKGIYSFGKPIHIEKEINIKKFELERQNLEKEIKRLTKIIESKIN